VIVFNALADMLAGAVVLGLTWHHRNQVRFGSVLFGWMSGVVAFASGLSLLIAVALGYPPVNL
jgi:hypothetical protein